MTNSSQNTRLWHCPKCGMAFDRWVKRRDHERETHGMHGVENDE